MKKGERTGKDIKCAYCGKEFYATLSRINRNDHLCCSEKCANLYKIESFKDVRKCEFCGKEMITTKGAKIRFCSNECQHEWQKTNVGSKNPKFEGKTIPCDYCGKMFDIHAYNLKKYKHHFCGVECRKAWHKNVFSQDEDWKDKSRIRGANTSKTIGLNTKPQIIINDLLDKLNVRYENEYNVKYYAIDNYLSDENLMIEVMGDYWHYNPSNRNKCKKDINPRQRITMGKDKAKHTYVSSYYNIEILYLWESDIVNNLDLCEKLITEYINNKGVMENYHSFNYTIEKESLILNENIIEMY